MGNVSGDLTLRADRALKGARKIYARTSACPAFGSIEGYNVETFDGVFKSCRNFDTLNKKLASLVLAAAKEGDVVYCVDGSVTEDEACKIILSRHRDVEICDSVSKGAGAYGAARLKCAVPVYLSAYSVKELKSCRACAVFDVDCRLIASDVKERLSDIFGEETYCRFVSGGKAKRIPIYEIDRQSEYDASCAVAVEEGEFLKRDRYDFEDLVAIMKTLRAPGGCPWDGAQTPESIKGNMIEEAYELVDAIERGDADGKEEETGDVLLQAAFHAVMAEERGEFTASDALTRIVKKLIFRHSHIFGGDRAADEGEALGVWEKNKVAEKGQKTFGETLLAVPKNFPACLRAQKVGKRASKCGFDFLSPVSASEKLWEEVQEMVERMRADDKEGTFEEGGDVLFAAVNTVRLVGVDCEEALRASTEKFIRRFVACEKLISADGKKIEEVTSDGLLFDYYWQRAKDET